MIKILFVLLLSFKLLRAEYGPVQYDLSIKGGRKLLYTCCKYTTRIHRITLTLKYVYNIHASTIYVTAYAFKFKTPGFKSK